MSRNNLAAKSPRARSFTELPLNKLREPYHDFSFEPDSDSSSYGFYRPGRNPSPTSPPIHPTDKYHRALRVRPLPIYSGNSIPLNKQYTKISMARHGAHRAQAREAAEEGEVPRSQIGSTCTRKNTPQTPPTTTHIYLFIFFLLKRHDGALNQSLERQSSKYNQPTV